MKELVLYAYLPMTGEASFPLSMKTGKNIENTQPLEINSIVTLATNNSCITYFIDMKCNQVGTDVYSLLE